MFLHTIAMVYTMLYNLSQLYMIPDAFGQHVPSSVFLWASSCNHHRPLCDLLCNKLGIVVIAQQFYRDCSLLFNYLENHKTCEKRVGYKCLFNFAFKFCAKHVFALTNI
jgi:hypothetical protein